MPGKGKFTKRTKRAVSSVGQGRTIMVKRFRIGKPEGGLLIAGTQGVNGSSVEAGVSIAAGGVCIYPVMVVRKDPRYANIKAMYDEWRVSKVKVTIYQQLSGYADMNVPNDRVVRCAFDRNGDAFGTDGQNDIGIVRCDAFEKAMNYEQLIEGIPGAKFNVFRSGSEFATVCQISAQTAQEGQWMNTQFSPGDGPNTGTQSFHPVFYAIEIADLTKAATEANADAARLFHMKRSQMMMQVAIEIETRGPRMQNVLATVV